MDDAIGMGFSSEAAIQNSLGRSPRNLRNPKIALKALIKRGCERVKPSSTGHRISNCAGRFSTADWKQVVNDGSASSSGRTSKSADQTNIQ
jgi:hypothetical protein